MRGKQAFILDQEIAIWGAQIQVNIQTVFLLVGWKQGVLLGKGQLCELKRREVSYGRFNRLIYSG